MSVCVGGLLDGRRAPPLAGRQRVPRAAPAAPARHPRRDEVADRGSLVPRPAPSAQVSGHGAASVARPRVLRLGLRGAACDSASARRGDRRGGADSSGTRPLPGVCVCRQPRKTRACPRRHFRPKTAPKGKGTRDLPPQPPLSAPPDAEDAAPGRRPKAAVRGGNASAPPK